VLGCARYFATIEEMSEHIAQEHDDAEARLVVELGPFWAAALPRGGRWPKVRDMLCPGEDRMLEMRMMSVEEAAEFWLSERVTEGLEHLCSCDQTEEHRGFVNGVWDTYRQGKANGPIPPGLLEWIARPWWPDRPMSILQIIAVKYHGADPDEVCPPIRLPVWRHPVQTEEEEVAEGAGENEIREEGREEETEEPAPKMEIPENKDEPTSPNALATPDMGPETAARQEEVRAVEVPNAREGSIAETASGSQQCIRETPSQEMQEEEDTRATEMLDPGVPYREKEGSVSTANLESRAREVVPESEAETVSGIPDEPGESAPMLSANTLARLWTEKSDEETSESETGLPRPGRPPEKPKAPIDVLSPERGTNMTRKPHTEDGQWSISPPQRIQTMTEEQVGMRAMISTGEPRSAMTDRSRSESEVSSDEISLPREAPVRLTTGSAEPRSRESAYRDPSLRFYMESSGRISEDESMIESSSTESPRELQEQRPEPQAEARGNLESLSTRRDEPSHSGEEERRVFQPALRPTPGQSRKYEEAEGVSERHEAVRPRPSEGLGDTGNMAVPGVEGRRTTGETHDTPPPRAIQLRPEPVSGNIQEMVPVDVFMDLMAETSSAESEVSEEEIHRPREESEGQLTAIVRPETPRNAHRDEAIDFFMESSGNTPEDRSSEESPSTNPPVLNKRQRRGKQPRTRTNVEQQATRSNKRPRDEPLHSGEEERRVSQLAPRQIPEQRQRHEGVEGVPERSEAPGSRTSERLGGARNPLVPVIEGRKTSGETQDAAPPRAIQPRSESVSENARERVPVDVFLKLMAERSSAESEVSEEETRRPREEPEGQRAAIVRSGAPRHAHQDDAMDFFMESNGNAPEDRSSEESPSADPPALNERRRRTERPRTRTNVEHPATRSNERPPNEPAHSGERERSTVRPLPRFAPRQSYPDVAQTRMPREESRRTEDGNGNGRLPPEMPAEDEEARGLPREEAPDGAGGEGEEDVGEKERKMWGRNREDQNGRQRRTSHGHNHEKKARERDIQSSSIGRMN
jgi:hypothetical protein